MEGEELLDVPEGENGEEEDNVGEEARLILEEARQ